MKTILIHGLGQTAGAWNKTTELLPQEDVLCPELSAFIGGGSYGELYSGFRGYLDELGQPLFLCGLSLGAVLALNYAADRPGSVRGLALAAPQFRMPKALLRVQGAVFRLMPERAFSGSGLTKKQMISLTRDMARLDFTPSLGRIECPVSIACGERDKANISAARELESILPQARLTVIRGAGHEINSEAPGETARFIIEALRR